MAGVILTPEQAKQLDALPTRQQRRAAERALRKGEKVAGIVDGVVDRSLGADTPGVLAGEEERAARMKDVLRLLSIALQEYKKENDREILEYIEYRLSLRGRLVMARQRWAYRLGLAVRFVLRPSWQAALGRLYTRLYHRSPPTAPAEDTNA